MDKYAWKRRVIQDDKGQITYIHLEGDMIVHTACAHKYQNERKLAWQIRLQPIVLAYYGLQVSQPVWYVQGPILELS